MLLLVVGLLVAFLGLFALWIVIWALTMNSTPDLPVGVYPEDSKR
jgi:hypothetical protein